MTRTLVPCGLKMTKAAASWRLLLQRSRAQLTRYNIAAENMLLVVPLRATDVTET